MVKCEHKGEKSMKKTIISIENCQKCAMLKAMAPDTESVVLQPDELLQFARAVGIKGMPFVVITGEPQELANELKGEK